MVLDTSRSKRNAERPPEPLYSQPRVTNTARRLVRTGGRRSGNEKDKANWLLIKKRDEFARSDDVLEVHPRSVLSGLTVEEMRDAPAAGLRVAAKLARRDLPEIAGALKF